MRIIDGQILRSEFLAQEGMIHHIKDLADDAEQRLGCCVVIVVQYVCYDIEYGGRCICAAKILKVNWFVCSFSSSFSETRVDEIFHDLKDVP